MRRLVTVSIALALAFTACASKKTKSNESPSPAKKNVNAKADMTHMPRGAIELKWDPANKGITVDGKIDGLAPNSKHPFHIHKGSCAKQGPVLFPLPDLTADAGGSATIAGSVASVKDGIPSSGWYVNVHTGPGLAPAEQFKPIACVDIVNTNHNMEAFQVFQGPFAALPGGDATGRAQIAYDRTQKTLTVVLTLSGLEPNTKHAAHIHSGSCQLQGQVAFGLQNVVADASGKASVTTNLKDIASFAGIFYVNVHNSTDLSTQVGFTPISCGDVISA